ncbi:hypothetical protein GCM10028801_36610 [Nocardioides maradonensis]
MSPHAAAPPLRVAAVWLASASATAATVLLTAPTVRTVVRGGAASRFDQVLVAASGALASLGCLVLLLTTTSVVVGLATGRLPRQIGPLRRTVLAACGVALLATGVPAAAHAAPSGHGHGSAIAGLPLPDRATGSGVGRGAADVVVRTGDSLWAIAAHHLGPDASEAEVATYCHRLFAHNAAVVGDDPDLIHPGLRLQLPPIRPLDR